MKGPVRVLMFLLAMAISVSAFAGFDGTYNFTSRVKDGAADMNGWNGTMTIKGNEVTRSYKSPDGKQEKFYNSTMTQNGDVYVLKVTKAYKPEYVGNEHKNKITVKGNTLIMQSDDGKFSETWTKK